jgi:hypothetical protein
MAVFVVIVFPVALNVTGLRKRQAALAGNEQNASTST